MLSLDSSLTSHRSRVTSPTPFPFCYRFVCLSFWNSPTLSSSPSSPSPSLPFTLLFFVVICLLLLWVRERGNAFCFLHPYLLILAFSPLSVRLSSLFSLVCLSSSLLSLSLPSLSLLPFLMCIPSAFVDLAREGGGEGGIPFLL